jgi:hypothetical protein
MYNASKIADYSFAMSMYRVKQFVNAVIFCFLEYISLAIMHAAASCCTPAADEKTRRFIFV